VDLVGIIYWNIILMHGPMNITNTINSWPVESQSTLIIPIISSPYGVNLESSILHNKFCTQLVKVVCIYKYFFFQALNFLVKSFGLLNDLFPFPSILDAGYPVFYLQLANVLFNKISLLKSNWCTLLVVSTLNKIKVTINTPTCFGSRRNHHQGVSQCLAKAIYIYIYIYIYGFFVHVDGDVVNGMAAYQPVVLVCVLCGGGMKTSSRLHTVHMPAQQAAMPPYH
jgi:hypothetical protein